MNTTLTPAARLSRLFTDLLRQDALIDRDRFDLESGLFPSRLRIKVPSVNIRETPKEFILEVAAPGLKRSDFKIEVDDHTLYISSEKEQEDEGTEADNDYFRKEYSYHSFTRSFALPENVKKSAIDARYDKGILTLTVPKEKESSVKAAHTIPVT